MRSRVSGLLHAMTGHTRPLPIRQRVVSVVAASSAQRPSDARPRRRHRPVTPQVASVAVRAPASTEPEFGDVGGLGSGSTHTSVSLRTIRGVAPSIEAACYKIDRPDVWVEGHLFVTRTGRAGDPIAPPYSAPVDRVWHRAREAAHAKTGRVDACPPTIDLRQACLSTEDAAAA